MKLIPLTQGKFAKVDDEDYEELIKYKWCAGRFRGGKWYAMTASNHEGKKSSVFMHRVLNNTPKGMATDHINGDGLDNQKDNLRSCTASQNGRNVGLWKTNKSGYKGVSWCKETRNWRALIYVGGRKIHLGMFRDVLEAASAYRKAELDYGKEFAYQVNTI